MPDTFNKYEMHTVIDNHLSQSSEITQLYKWTLKEESNYGVNKKDLFKLPLQSLLCKLIAQQRKVEELLQDVETIQ